MVTLAARGPFGLSTTSNFTLSPSLRVRKPSARISEWWTKTSGPPSRERKPKPLASLNHLTVPSIMNVQVTDDDADSRELVRLTLAMHEIQVVEAAGGIECLKVAQDTRPDAILLDVMMPSMDGPTTLTALRANPVTASIPVIFLTASAMPSEIE